MARREWAEKEARKRLQPSEFDEYSCTYESALKREHARAVRIVKRLAVKAEQASKKQRVQDFRDNGSPAKKYTDADLLDSAALLMRSLLVSLQKGRA